MTTAGAPGRPGHCQRRVATDDQVVTTWITAAELHYGAAKSIAPEKNVSS